MNKYSLALLISFLFAGCAIGPDYVKPDFQTPKELRHNDDNLSNVKFDERWWRSFGDEELTNYVDLVLKNNLDMKYANAQIDMMLSQFDLANSYLYPQLSANGSHSRQKQSENTSSSASKKVTDSQAVTLQIASYEIDLWGKVRRMNEAARAKLLSSKDNARSVSVALATTAVVTYAKLLVAIEQDTLAREIALNSSEKRRLASIMLKEGAISTLELNEYISGELVAKNQQLNYQKKLLEASNQYYQLLGQNPKELPKVKSESFYKLLVKIPAGIKSESILKRPDIVVAEQELISANAQIGVARAAYLPSISLTGGFGFQSQDMSSLFDANSRAWLFTPSVSIPIFTAGRTAASVDGAEVAKAQALINYEKTIINAFVEIDNALYGYKNAVENEFNVAKNASLAEENLRLAQLKQSLGVFSKWQLINYQLSNQNAKITALDSKISLISSAVNVIKSFGGSL